MSTTMRPLPLVGRPAPEPVLSEEWLRAARRARLLSWISLAWMGTEGLVGVATGQAKWKMVGEILLAWVSTVPCGAVLAAAAYWLIRLF